MTKLRLVEDRKNETEHEFDLRGLGEDPLLTQGHPFTALAVTGVSHGEVSRHFGRHGFQVVTGLQKNTVFVRDPKPQPGQHKVSAVKLFTALIACSDELKHGRFVFFEVSQLAHRLKHSLHHTGTLTLNEVMLAAYREQETRTESYVTLELRTTMHLEQAGFPLHADGVNALKLTWDDFTRLRARALHDAQTAPQADLRRAA